MMANKETVLIPHDGVYIPIDKLGMMAKNAGIHMVDHYLNSIMAYAIFTKRLELLDYCNDIRDYYKLARYATPDVTPASSHNMPMARELTVTAQSFQISDDDFECVNLKFFDEKVFCSYERQLALRNLFNEAFKRMDLNTGRDLVAIYIGYHFFTGQLYNKKCYTDCIQDLENLLPGRLPKIKEDEQTRSQKYKSYAESLGLECEKWFIEDGCLPKKNEWILRKYNYNVDDERRKRIQKLSTDIYKGMKDIIK